MWQFANQHEIITLLIVCAMLETIYLITKVIAERNKPIIMDVDDDKDYEDEK